MLLYHQTDFKIIRSLMIGFKNEILEVIEYAGKKYKKCNLWKCICKCGKEIYRLTTEIKNKKPASCGCWRKNRPSNNKNLVKLTHGLRNHPLYNRWNNIKQRCYNLRHPFFKYYGLKGIIMCEEWKNNFKSFYSWCLENNWQNELVIDRINANGNYEPNNCQFITSSENTKKANLNNKYFNKNNKTVCYGGYTGS